MSTYMSALVLAGLFPLFLSFYPPLAFWRNFKPLALTLGVIVAVFGAWDIWATLRGHWSFDPNGVYGLRLANLPVEEWLFFIVIPFCCIFTWEALNFIYKRAK